MIKGNEGSEYYADIVTPLWNQCGIYPVRFDAITPADIPHFIETYDIRYGCREDNRIEATETERASTLSHYQLWKKSAADSKRFLILEHDSYPDNPPLYDDVVYDLYSFAPGTAAYVIDPEYAGYLAHQVIEREIVRGGTTGLIHHFSKPPWFVKSNFTDPGFAFGARQLISRKYGSTSTHSGLYETTLTFNSDGSTNTTGTRDIDKVFKVID